MSHAQLVNPPVPVHASALRYLILAAQREGSRQMAAQLRPHQLTPAQAEVLLVLAEHEPLTLAEVGRLIVCEANSPSRIVDTMVKRGLINREPGQIDRRVVYLQLAQPGRELLATLRRVDTEVDSLIMGSLTEEEQEVMATALWKIIGGTASSSVLLRRFPAEK